MLSNLPALAWKYKVREEDLRYYDILKYRWCVDDARRAVDEKMEQLKVIAESSIIISGFILSALCEMQISLKVPSNILAFYGLTTSSAISFTLTASTLSMVVLVALYSFKTDNIVSFERLWKTICENDWQIAFNCFILGTCLFTVTLGFSSWVLYWHHQHGYIASILVSIICFITIVYWYTRVYLKWYVALEKGYKFESKNHSQYSKQNQNQNSSPRNHQSPQIDVENSDDINQRYTNEEIKSEYPTE